MMGDRLVVQSLDHRDGASLPPDHMLRGIDRFLISVG